jgi:hypothetical protein
MGNSGHYRGGKHVESIVDIVHRCDAFSDGHRLFEQHYHGMDCPPLIALCQVEEQRDWVRANYTDPEAFEMDFDEVGAGQGRRRDEQKLWTCGL